MSLRPFAVCACVGACQFWVTVAAAAPEANADSPPAEVEAPASDSPAAPTPDAPPAEATPATPEEPAPLPAAPLETERSDEPVPATPTSPDAEAAPEPIGGAPTAPGAEDADELDPDLLSGPAAPTTATPPPPNLRGEAPASTNVALARQYRPTHNPGRVNLGLRGMFINMGGDDEMGGRMGGVQLDVGQAWNDIGYGVTLSAWGGRVYLPEGNDAEMNVMLGIGPNVSLGRRALVGRGYLDLQLGYDFYYGIVNRRGQTTVVAPQAGESVRVANTDNIVPHGPRLNLDLGLLTNPDRDGRFFHGVGASVGYQALVHTFNQDLPVGHMLMLGFSYWMG